GHPPWTRIFCALPKRRTGVSWPLTRRSNGLRVSVVHGGCPLPHPPHCRHVARTLGRRGSVPGAAGFVREKHDGRHDHADTEEPGEAAEELGGAEPGEDRKSTRLN